jgi:ceramide synthetase
MHRCIFRPWGKWLGIKVRRAQPDPEVLAAMSRGPQGLALLAKKRELTQRQVERLVRKHEALRKPEKLAKFCETSWRWFFYLSMTLYGAYVLYDKPWTWNILNCWLGFPKHVSYLVQPFFVVLFSPVQRH